MNPDVMQWIGVSIVWVLVGVQVWDAVRAYKRRRAAAEHFSNLTPDEWIAYTPKNTEVIIFKEGEAVQYVAPRDAEVYRGRVMYSLLVDPQYKDISDAAVERFRKAMH